MSDIQRPPHDDELENAIESELNSFLLKQRVYSDKRMEDVYKQLTQLQRVVEFTQKRAQIALTAYTKTLIAVREESTRIGGVVQELTEGLENIDDVVKSRASLESK